MNPEFYLRPATEDVPYPRADPGDASRLPMDTWAAATVPATVRLEFVGDAEAVEVAYRTTTDDLGYRGRGAGTGSGACSVRGRKISKRVPTPGALWQVIQRRTAKPGAYAVGRQKSA